MKEKFTDMDDKRRHQEEFLERLWEMHEQGLSDIEDLTQHLLDRFNLEFFNDLVTEGLVVLSEQGRRISLTETGIQRAKLIIRAHRIGERLLFDVFGSDFEPGACEFEHTSTVALVDALCTILGHPRECPHGLPIPEGECCLRSATTVSNVVKPLTELEIGQTARVAYINSRDDGRLHKLDSLQIRPGSMVKLHQRYPCYVIECEGASIALDEEIVANVHVWSTNPFSRQPMEKKDVTLQAKNCGWWNKVMKLQGKWRRKLNPG
ncbi:MAG: metal-dependent transcriptional regulator [Deltaproteobacteria bacterium]|nr:metal-dependent transcriptional regulator [Deltaproteobacteria bacterium]